jgi:hypothetical protein
MEAHTNGSLAQVVIEACMKAAWRQLFGWDPKQVGEHAGSAEGSAVPAHSTGTRATRTHEPPTANRSLSPTPCAPPAAFSGTSLRCPMAQAVTAEQLAGKLDQAFPSVDANRDGMVDLAELTEYVASAGRGDAHMPAALLQQMVATLDVDKDGKLSRAELKAMIA